MKKRALVVGLILAVAIAGLVWAQRLGWKVDGFSQGADLLFVGDFEAGDFAGWHCKNGSWGNCPTVVSAQGSAQPRAGSFMMRSFLNPQTSAVAYRTETVLRGLGDTVHEFSIGAEYWLGFSIYLPEGQPLDVNVIMQIKHRSDPGECSRNPPMALRVSGGNFKVTMKWDSKRDSCVDGKPVYEGDKGFILGAAPTGQWIDFVWHFRPSYESDGFLEVYQDGQLVLDYQGPNYYNDEQGPFVKMGIYNATWKERPDKGGRLVYHDEVRVGGADASYEAVSPGSALPVAPTSTSTPTSMAGPGGEWYDGCTSYSTLTPRPTYTPALTPTCRLPPPTATMYPTSTLYPKQP